MEGHAHNDMLSPYSNTVLRKSQSKSPRRPDDETKTQDMLENEGLSNKSDRELTDYLVNRQSIDYPKLMGDAIAKVDELLIKACKKDGQVGGTTLLLSILDGSTFWVANVGDSRGVLKNANSEVLPLSYDHKPSQLKEKKRIEQAGGFVSLNGVWRVQGVLATSRALGDYPLKDQKVVVCEPDVLSFQLDETSPHFAVLASDGLWDTHSNEQAVNHVEASLKKSDSMLNAARDLARDAFI